MNTYTRILRKVDWCRKAEKKYWEKKLWKDIVDRKTSVSDSDLYPAYCKYAAHNEKEFSRFKSNIIYNEILEHTSYYVGLENLWQIIMNNKVHFKKEDWDLFKWNDRLGGAQLFDYSDWINKYCGINGKQLLSPSTLRYIKVLQDLISFFNFQNIHSISEIGIGYGGQGWIISAYSPSVTEYRFVDLPEVIELSSRYIISFEKVCEISHYKFIDGTKMRDPIMSDLLISNYAFSELTRAVQDIYLEKIIKKADRGYIIWNELSYRNMDGYSVEELLEMIPGAHCIDERPLTYVNNKVILWGDV